MTQQNLTKQKNPMAKDLYRATLKVQNLPSSLVKILEHVFIQASNGKTALTVELHNQKAIDDYRGLIKRHPDTIHSLSDTNQWGRERTENPEAVTVEDIDDNRKYLEILGFSLYFQNEWWGLETGFYEQVTIQWEGNEPRTRRSAIDY